MTLNNLVHSIAVISLIAGCAQTAPTGPGQPSAMTHSLSAAPLRIDMNVHQLDDATLSALRTTKAGAIRTTLYWAQNPVGSPALDRWVSDIRRMKAAGFDVLVVVHQEPQANQSLSWQARVDAFAEYMAAVAPQLPGTAWQLFNEIDSRSFDDLFTTVAGTDRAVSRPETQRPAGQRYGMFLGAVIPRIRGADPTSRIVTSGIGLAPATFLSAMREALPTGVSPDVIAVHAYGYPVSIAFEQGYNDAKRVFPELPVWATEFGMNGGQIPGSHTMLEYDNLQQREIADAVARNPGYDRAFLYVLWTGEDGDFPIFRRDWSPRPAAAWVSAHNSAIVR